MKAQDISGIKWNRLTAIRQSAVKHKWIFLCDCGCEKEMLKVSVTSGGSKSCGCLNLERIVERNIARGSASGFADHSLYDLYHGMKARCRDRVDYAGRGITVCERWLNSFEDFILDMGSRPNGYSIDRVDNDGNYEPSNCRWASRQEQSENQRSNVAITYNGKTQPISAWARELGMRRKTLYQRYCRGWSVERMLTEDLRK